MLQHCLQLCGGLQKSLAGSHDTAPLALATATAEARSTSIIMLYCQHAPLVEAKFSIRLWKKAGLSAHPESPVFVLCVRGSSTPAPVNQTDRPDPTNERERARRERDATTTHTTRHHTPPHATPRHATPRHTTRRQQRQRNNHRQPAHVTPPSRFETVVRRASGRARATAGGGRASGRERRAGARLRRPAVWCRVVSCGVVWCHGGAAELDSDALPTDATAGGARRATTTTTTTTTTTATTARARAPP